MSPCGCLHWPYVNINLNRPSHQSVNHSSSDWENHGTLQQKAIGKIHTNTNAAGKWKMWIKNTCKTFHFGIHIYYILYTLSLSLSLSLSPYIFIFVIYIVNWELTFLKCFGRFLSRVGIASVRSRTTWPVLSISLSIKWSEQTRECELGFHFWRWRWTSQDFLLSGSIGKL